MAKAKRRTVSPLVKGVVILVLLAALAGIGSWLWITREWTGAGPLAQSRDITIPEGATLGAAARALEKAGAIRSTTGFLRQVRLFGSDGAIRAGEYEIPAHASAADIFGLLQSGKVLQRMVTIPEGMPSVLVYDRLMAQPLLSGDIAVPAEGSVLPDSYGFERGATRAAVLKRMQDAMTRTVDRLWAARKPGTVVTSKADAVTLASIVEKETALASERRMVAAVYSNRLRTGMRLQADPTIIYPLTHGRALGRRIRRSEVHAVNGYNTYAIAGLPEGPIANPGVGAIAAVLDPAKTDAIYFVASGKGGHVFARTLAEHQANVARYYALRRARGEM